MPVFRDTDHLYSVMGRLLERVSQEKVIVEKLARAGIVVSFVTKDPQGRVTVDLRQDPIGFRLGETDLKPDVEFIQSADTSHMFWLGKLNVPRAIATRKVIARGSVPKSLALLPAIRPVYGIYEQVLRDMGEAALIPAQSGQARARGRSIVDRLSGWIKKAPQIDYSRLNPALIQLIETRPTPPESRSQELPKDERSLKLEMLKRMILIRALEDRLAREFAAGTIPSEALHLSIGQEACAVGACFALEDSDYMASTHRGHGHLIAKGADVSAITAELLGKSTGLCKGLGGCMHVTDGAVGALGANGIVGASSLIALGAAMSAAKRGSGQVALAFMGDGATAQGMFHEALNFAAVFSAPLILFVENNQYAEFTPVSGHARVEAISDRAKGYGVYGETINGNDVWAVYRGVQKAAERARRGEGPVLLEGVTYRWCGHTEGESFQYRTDEEIADWKQNDPIEAWRDRLMEEGILTEEQAGRLMAQAEEQVERAMGSAEEAPEPDERAMEACLFAPEPRELYAIEAVSQGAKREATVSEALREALAEEMNHDPSVYLIGEDVRGGGYFAVTSGLVDSFGPDRIIDTPISEYAIVGSCVGAAMTGMRPVAEIQFSDFITCCMDPLVNQAAKLRFMSGGQYSLPLVVRTPGGGGIGMAAQHSQSLESWLLHIPGLIVIAAGTAHDAKGLLKSAIRSNNPVVFFENKLLYAATGPIPEGDYTVPIGKADVKRSGSDITIVAVGAMVGPALEAARELASQGIDAEVVDPRTLAPCDWETIVRSTAKTGRLVVAEAGTLTCGFGAECAARVTDAAWGRLRGPVKRVAGKDIPIPYNRNLENSVVPHVKEIVAAARALV